MARSVILYIASGSGGMSVRYTLPISRASRLLLTWDRWHTLWRQNMVFRIRYYMYCISSWPMLFSGFRMGLLARHFSSGTLRSTSRGT